MWILIIVATMYSESAGYPVSVSVTSVPDFYDQEACMTAGKALPKPPHAERDESSIVFSCVKHKL